MSLLKSEETGLAAGETNRRSALQMMAGVGAAALTLPLLDGFGLISSAATQATIGLGKNEGDLVYIPGASVEPVLIAEWEGFLGAAEAGVTSNRIAQGKEAVAKAPANAARYESKTFNYPSGSLRTLTFKKGSPVYHQITFESEIFVVKGSVTLTPLYGHKGEPVTVNAGDALFLPSGVLRNPNAAEETVLLLAEVAFTGDKPKGSIVRGDSVTANPNLQWQEGGKEFSASKPEDIAKAPANAQRSKVGRYAGDGNSIRIATFEKGGRGNSFTITRSDVLIYIPKGRFRRTEGNQTFDLVAGDTTREKIGNAGFWIPLEDDSVFIATDAPFTPATFTPGLVAR